MWYALWYVLWSNLGGGCFACAFFLFLGGVVVLLVVLVGALWTVVLWCWLWCWFVGVGFIEGLWCL